MSTTQAAKRDINNFIQCTVNIQGVKAEEVLTNDWFLNQFKKSRSNLGVRYTPESNIELPISDALTGLNLSEGFLENHSDLSIYWIDKIKDLRRHIEEYSGDKLNTFDAGLKTISAAMEINSSVIDIDSIASELNVIESIVDFLYESVIYTKNAQQGKSNKYEYFKHTLWTTRQTIREIRDYIESDTVMCFNSRKILITGEAGSGKSHLLADIVSKHISNGLPGILLLGQHYRGGTPWESYLPEVGLSGVPIADLLSEFNRQAQIKNTRAIIAIDALNEGNEKDSWKKHIRGFITEILNYEHISIVLSCRSTYEQRLFGTISRDELPRLMHNGFTGVEDRAIEIYASHNGIVHPTVPILSPEFSNPLFLKTFCESLKRTHQTTFPVGIRGTNSLFNFYIDSINVALLEKGLDIDPKSNLAREAIKAIVEEMQTETSHYLSRERAKEILDSVYLHNNYSQSLLFHLLDEGVLAEEIEYNHTIDADDLEGKEVIRFSFERFADYSITQYLLEMCVDPANINASFSEESELYSILSEKYWLYNEGVLEQLSILVPELYAYEFLNLIPKKFLEREYHFNCFLKSIIWRKPESCTEETLNLIRNGAGDFHVEILNTLLHLATEPGHPFNMDFMHKKLIRILGIADRDSFWSVPVAMIYADNEPSVLHRYINWSQKSSSSCNDHERLRLTALCLTWCFTSSNRLLRDSATKALVSLLSTYPNTILHIMNQFKDIEDDYVTERLYASAYGITLNSSDLNFIIDLANHTYSSIFDTAQVFPHILVRDYARNIIEYAEYRGCDLRNIQTSKIKPPYKYSWDIIIPDGNLKEVFDDSHDRVANSLTPFHGDFYNYTLNAVHYWTNTPFENNEFNRERDLLFDIRTELQDNHDLLSMYDSFLNNGVKGIYDFEKLLMDYKEGNTENLMPECIESLQNQETFEMHWNYVQGEKARVEVLKEYFGKRWHQIEGLQSLHTNSLSSYSKKDAAKWIYKFVRSYGWTEEQFENFERYYITRDRMDHKVERIGKKYQWIGFYRFLAYLTDKYYFKGSSYSNDVVKFDYAVDIDERNIDPSICIRSTSHDNWAYNPTKSWWHPHAVKFRDCSDQARKEWLFDDSDIPQFKDLLLVTHPKISDRFYLLQNFLMFKEKRSKDLVHRDMYYKIVGCIIDVDDAKPLLTSIRGQEVQPVVSNLDNQHFTSQNIVGEYPWHGSWAGVIEYEPVNVYGYSVLKSSNEKSFEADSLDYSVEKSFNVPLPSTWLYEKLQLSLQSTGSSFRFVDKNGEVTFFDPSFEEDGQSAVLIHSYKIQEVLKSHKKTLAWFISGEKRLIQPDFRPMSSTGWQNINGFFYLDNNAIIGDQWLVNHS